MTDKKPVADKKTLKCGVCNKKDGKDYGGKKGVWCFDCWYDYMDNLAGACWG